jgi:dienelactone hydrolase
MSELRPVICNHEGVGLQGLVAEPSTTGPHPAVLVMHTALGLGKQMRHQVLTLAKMGYIAVATDMYGGGACYTNPAEAGSAFSSLRNNPQLLRARTVAWHALVSGMANVDPKRIGAIGYCFGGHCVLELARSGADVKAVVSFHGLLETSMPAQRGAIKGIVSVYTGAKDPYAPEEHVQAFRHEMTAAEAQWQVTVFGDAEHGFTDPDASKMKRPGIAYHGLADRMSWAGTASLLATELGNRTAPVSPGSDA